MSTEDYVSEVRRTIRDLIEAAMKESDADMKKKSQEAIENLRALISDVVEVGRGQLVGSESRIALNQIANMLGYSNGKTLMIAFGVKPKTKPNHVPPPPP
ncbi:hypothetical protein EU538_11365 [Candidatus Thorarchaeota archaeon]|jgi:hypothetical protein|nr:MAG: hypothetical protein EU538_11365 [Candidatus Thorarchaeota archaeon]